MTRCRDVDRLATAYVDGELDDRRSSAVRGHLRVCRRCAERVEDEARVRELAADLAPVDPSPGLWRAIDARLAEAEIGDSRRSALWLWVQRVLDGARRNALALGLCSAAAAALLVWWLPGRGREADERPVARAGGATPSAAERVGADARPPVGECSGARLHEEHLLCQMHESDRRYLDAIADLTVAVSEERSSWAVGDAARFDAALAELALAAELERVRLAGQPSAPASRDPLYAIYRAQIDLLSSAVVAGDPLASTGAASRRGVP